MTELKKTLISLWAYIVVLGLLILIPLFLFYLIKLIITLI